MVTTRRRSQSTGKVLRTTGNLVRSWCGINGKFQGKSGLSDIHYTTFASQPLTSGSHLAIPRLPFPGFPRLVVNRETMGGCVRLRAAACGCVRLGAAMCGYVRVLGKQRLRRQDAVAGEEVLTQDGRCGRPETLKYAYARLSTLRRESFFQAGAGHTAQARRPRYFRLDEP
jgi:hypothetical protein